jgi:hypothetical protein
MWWLGIGVVNGTAVWAAGHAARSLWPESTALQWIVAIAASVAAQMTYRVIAVKLGFRDMPMWPKKT